jgi:hypothetical protein
LVRRPNLQVEFFDGTILLVGLLDDLQQRSVMRGKYGFYPLSHDFVFLDPENPASDGIDA